MILGVATAEDAALVGVDEAEDELEEEDMLSDISTLVQ